MNSQRRKIISVVLIVLTVGLVGIAVYLGATIQQNQSINNADAADGSCSGAGGDGACAGVTGHINCGGRAEGNCKALSCVGCSWTPASSTGTSTGTNPPTNPVTGSTGANNGATVACCVGSQTRYFATTLACLDAGGSTNAPCAATPAAPSCIAIGSGCGGAITGGATNCCNNGSCNYVGSQQQCVAAAAASGNNNNNTPVTTTPALCGSDGRSNCSLQNVGGCSNGQQRQTCYSNVTSSIGCYDTYSSCSSSNSSGGSNNIAPTVTCYRCTTATGDANACSGTVVNGTTCPAGTSTSSTGCATAVGGSCPGPTTTGTITCYGCSLATDDGNSCTAITVTGTSCVSGTSTSSTGCAAAAGGACSVIVEDPGTNSPIVLPNTALISDEADSVLLGGMLLLIGFLAVKFHVIDETSRMFNWYFSEVREVKNSREEFEKKLNKNVDHK